MVADPLHQSDNYFPSRVEIGIGTDSEPLSVVVDESDPTVAVVSVVGQIDMLTEFSLRDHLSGLLAARPERLIIDLSQVSFMGATALSVLINARHAAGRQGITLQLRAPSRRAAARPLHIAGLDCLFEILPSATHRDTLDSLHPDQHVGAPHPREADRTESRVPTPSESSVETPENEYAHLIPLQRRYAELAPDEPQRQRLRDQLISGYRPVAEHLARRFTGRGEPLEDLIQVATVGLINAVDRFDVARGAHFLSFAVPTITGEIRRYFRDHGWSTRVPRRLKDLNLAIRRVQAELSQQLGRAARPSEVADRLGTPTSEVIEALHAAEAYRSSSLEQMLSCGDTTTAPEEFIGELDAQMCLIEDRAMLRPLLAELARRDRVILGLRFFHELTQSQIAEQVGVSQMHVSRLLNQTLRFLHDRMTSSEPSTPEDRPSSQLSSSRNSFNDQLPISPAPLSPGIPTPGPPSRQ
jgi:RNA polymerase sigma-B factor